MPHAMVAQQRIGSPMLTLLEQHCSARYDAVLRTERCPLPNLAQVGGPAGTMEGGRQADVAKAILSAKNIPYVVAAPLLIQVLLFWITLACPGPFHSHQCSASTITPPRASFRVGLRIAIRRGRSRRV